MDSIISAASVIAAGYVDVQAGVMSRASVADGGQGAV